MNNPDLGCSIFRIGFNFALTSVSSHVTMRSPFNEIKMVCVLNDMVKRVVIFLDRLYWLWLILATPFLLFSTPKRSLAMLVVPALFLLRWLALKVKSKAASPDNQISSEHQPPVIPSTPLNLALVLLAIMVFVSLWVTFDINLSLSKVCGVVLGWGIFFAFTRAGRTSRSWWLCFILFLGIGAIIATLGLLGTNWLAKINILAPITSRLPPRIKGLPGAMEGFQPNTVAGTLLWVVPGLFTSSWFLLARMKDLSHLLGYGRTIVAIGLTVGATLFIMAVLILTQSREGYISLVLMLPMLALIALPPKKRRYGLIILILLVILTSIPIVSHREAMQNWVLGNYQTTDPALSLESFKGRLEVWSRAIFAIHDFPFTGMGMDVFRKAAPVLYPFFDVPLDKDIGHAHNEFLQAALDLGTPGLIAFIAIYIISFWMLIQVWQKARNGIFTPYDGNDTKFHPAQSGYYSSLGAALLEDGICVRMLVLGLGGGLMAHIIWGMTDAIALGARSSFLFWVLLGLICSLHQQIYGSKVDKTGARLTSTTKSRGRA